MVVNTQTLIDQSRYILPDLKTRLRTVRNEDIGRIELPVGNRNVLYPKHSPVASIFLYVAPHKFSSIASLNLATSNQKVFMFNTTTLACTFANGTTDAAFMPTQFTPVLASYEYYEDSPYSYSDNELVSFLPSAIGYVNSKYNFSYTYTGTIYNFEVTDISTSDIHLLSFALALVVKKQYIDEQIKRGLGVKFRTSMQSIDTSDQLKSYNDSIEQLEKNMDKMADTVIHGSIDGMAQIINIYSEDVVNT